MSTTRLRHLAMLMSMASAIPAAAGPNDALHAVADVGYGHDDNLLRVPDNFPGFGGERADSWWQREGGLIFDKTYSRQRISVVAKVSKYDFDHFKQLNYDGKTMSANWFWQLGNHLDGKIGTSYEKVLAPYTDFATDQRNLRTARSSFAEGAWRFHASWRARAGFQRDRYSYELLGERFNNRTERASELELDYLSRADNTVGLVARHVNGHYPYPRPIGMFMFNDDFSQDELKLRVKYNASGLTGIDALVGYTERKQPAFGAGKTSGAAGRVNLSYQPHGKTVLTASLWRDFAPLESTLVSYTLNNGAAVGAQWNASAKIRVNADFSAERRNYNARMPFDGDGDLRDSIHTGSVRATWVPHDNVQVTLGAARQARSGSVVLGTGSFTSNSVTLSASAQF